MNSSASRCLMFLEKQQRHFSILDNFRGSIQSRIRARNIASSSFIAGSGYPYLREDEIYRVVSWYLSLETPLPAKAETWRYTTATSFVGGCVDVRIFVTFKSLRCHFTWYTGCQQACFGVLNTQKIWHWMKKIMILGFATTILCAFRRRLHRCLDGA